MAIWQFSLALLPQSWLDAGGDIGSIFSKDSYDISPSWSTSTSGELRERLSDLLPPGSSWSKSLTIWGAEDRDDIHLWQSGDSVEELSVRFDLREPNHDLFASIANLARDLNLAILDVEHKQILESTAASLLQAAADSEAARFVIDPQAFLSAIGENDKKAT